MWENLLLESVIYFSPFLAWFPLLLTGRIVGFQIAERVLQSGKQVLHHARVGIDMLAMAEDFNKDTAFAFAPYPAQSIISVGAFEFLFGLVRFAHL